MSLKQRPSIWGRLFMGLVFLFLYAPIFVLIVFSFNNSKSRTVWNGFTLNWYVELFRDSQIMNSLYTTLLVALLSAVIATIAGTFASIGFYNMKRRWRDPLMTVNNIPMMNADIVTGVSLCLFFVAAFAGWNGFVKWMETTYRLTAPRLSLGQNERRLHPSVCHRAHPADHRKCASGSSGKGHGQAEEIIPYVLKALALRDIPKILLGGMIIEKDPYLDPRLYYGDGPVPVRLCHEGRAFQLRHRYKQQRQQRPARSGRMRLG